MNIIEVQESLKDLPDNALMQEMQNPTGSAPQFLVLSELKRRKRMRDDYQRRQAGEVKTVAEEAVTAAGAPQEGIMQVSRAMNPNSSIAQNTGMDQAMPQEPVQAPQMMADGGIVRMQQGGLSSFIPDRAMLLGEGAYNRGTGRATVVDGVTVELLPDGRVVSATTGDTVSPELAAKAIAKLSPDLTGDTAAFTEFAGTPSMYRPEAGMPTQEDLDLKAVSDARNSAFGIGESDVRPTLPSLGGKAPAAIGEINSFDVRGPAVPSLNAPEMSSPTEIMQFSQGMREVAADSQPDNPSIFESLEGVVSGKTPNEKANEFIEYFNSLPQSLKTPDDENPMVSMISSVLPEGPTATEQMAEFLANENKRIPNPDPVAQAREDEINSLLAVFNDPNRTEAEVKAARQRLEQIGAKDRAIATATEALEGFGQAVTDRIAADAADIYGTLGTGANLLGSTDTATALFEAQKEAEAKVTPSEIETEAEAVVSNIPEGIGLNLPDTAAAESDTESTPTLSSVLSGLDDQSLSVGDLLPKDTDTSTAPAGRKSTSTSGGTGGTGGGVGGRIAQMLADREKSAEADKWMALAQAGMALMASDQPTFGGALGEAGLVGVGAMQKARKQYDADILDLLTLQQRANAASSRKSGGLTASNMISLMDDLRNYKGDIQDRIDELNSPTNLMEPEAKAAQLERLQAELMRTDIELGTYRNALRGGGTGGSSFDVRGGSTQQPSVGYSLGTATQ